MGAPFIAIEGIDGSGGTTQTRLLVSRLGSKAGSNRVCQAQKAPWPMSPFEPAIRAILKHEDTEGYSDTLLDLFILDRKTHWADIAESLRDKTWVVSDRWHYSTMVYQNIHADIEVSDIETRLLELAPHADLTIAIDMSTEIAGGRMAARQRDGFEKDGGLQRAVRQLYLGLARVKTGLVVVSGNGCAEDVHQRVWDAVVARFPDA